MIAFSWSAHAGNIIPPPRPIATRKSQEESEICLHSSHGTPSHRIFSLSRPPFQPIEPVVADSRTFDGITRAPMDDCWQLVDRCKRRLCDLRSHNGQPTTRGAGQCVERGGIQMNNTGQGKKRRYVEVGLAVVCLAVLWAANVKTSWLPRAAEAARVHILRAAKEHEVLKGPTDELANEPLAHTSSQEKENADRPVRANTRKKVTAEELLQKDFELKKELSDAEFRQQWDAVNRKFGPVTNNAQIEAARNRELSELHLRQVEIANRVIAEHRMTMKRFAEIDELAKAGMLNTDPAELKMRLYLPSEIERAVVPEKRQD